LRVFFWLKFASQNLAFGDERLTLDVFIKTSGRTGNETSSRKKFTFMCVFVQSEERLAAENKDTTSKCCASAV